MNHLVVCEMVHRCLTQTLRQCKHIEPERSLCMHLNNTNLTFVRICLLTEIIIFIIIARKSGHFEFYCLIDYILS